MIGYLEQLFLEMKESVNDLRSMVERMTAAGHSMEANKVKVPSLKLVERMDSKFKNSFTIF